MDLLSSKLAWELANPKWAATLNAFLSSPWMNGHVLENVDLVKNDNVVNHKLGRKLQGWVLVRNGSPITVFDNQIFNQTPELTLFLSASGAARVSIYVF